MIENTIVFFTYSQECHPRSSFCVPRFHLRSSSSDFDQRQPIFKRAEMARVRVRSSTSTFIDVLLAILLPPLGVFLAYGCASEFWICLLLTILGYIPGIIYALYVLVG